jgi:hypothetical protein
MNSNREGILAAAAEFFDTNLTNYHEFKCAEDTAEIIDSCISNYFRRKGSGLAGDWPADLRGGKSARGGGENFGVAKVARTPALHPCPNDWRNTPSGCACDSPFSPFFA